MRYWWRALHPDCKNGKELYQRESALFGGTAGGDDEGGMRARFSLRLEGIELTPRGQKLLPHRYDSEQDAYPPGNKFDIVLLANKDQTPMLKALIELAGLLGGLGQRSRRGFGNFRPEASISPKELNLEYIKKLVAIIRPDITFYGNPDNDNSSFTKFPKPYRDLLPFPFLERISIGKYFNDTQSLLKGIGQATSQRLRNNSKKYKSTIGDAGGSYRYASSVWASIGPQNAIGGVAPLITQVYPVPEKGNSDLQYQDDFVASITPELLNQ